MLNVNTNMTFQLFPVFTVEGADRFVRLPNGQWISLTKGGQFCSTQLSQELEKELDYKRDEIFES